MKKFVIVVDAQVDFMNEDGKLYVPGAQDLIVPLNSYLFQLELGETEGVLYTFDTHTDESYPGSPEAEMFPPHCYKGTPGWELAVIDAPLEVPTYKLEKNVFNMWEEDDIRVVNERGIGTPRDTFFSFLKENNIEVIEVVGVASEFCVKWAVDGLTDRGFIVHVREDLVKGIEKDIQTVLAEDWVNKRVTLV